MFAPVDLLSGVAPILACSCRSIPSHYARRPRVTGRIGLLDLALASHLNRKRRPVSRGSQRRQKASGRTALDFALPADLVAYLAELDQFITREIKPIENADDNIRFFDHRREWARTDFDNGGAPGPGAGGPGAKDAGRGGGGRAFCVSLCSPAARGR